MKDSISYIAKPQARIAVPQASGPKKHCVSLNKARFVLSLAFAACTLLLSSCMLSGESAPNTAPASQANSQVSSAAPSFSQEFAGLVIDGTPPNESQLESLANLSLGYTHNIQPEYQLPELPSGCEVVALTIALRSMGFTLDKTEIADNHLIINGSEWGFLASPYEDKGGGFPPGIVAAANSYLSAAGTTFQAHDLTGSSFESLQALVNRGGVPVLCWTTLYLTAPNYDAELGAIGSWYVNEHCVVFYGTNSSGTLLIANPLEGLTEVDAHVFAQVYDECGSMAMAILPRL